MRGPVSCVLGGEFVLSGAGGGVGVEGDATGEARGGGSGGVDGGGGERGGGVVADRDLS